MPADTGRFFASAVVGCNIVRVAHSWVRRLLVYRRPGRARIRGTPRGGAETFLGI